ncbi:hypothetical protein NSPZN2_11013 [Nitrospira defluvii]|uniref:Uncharacterized protein n=1 Tax=Nitrospira defluvii TaxID=330214 RepID=A0ABM8QNH1_9BACT|nr:hypothetical protein NSPZN2_11013 [Nitrospira defluvii]
MSRWQAPHHSIHNSCFREKIGQTSARSAGYATQAAQSPSLSISPDVMFPLLTEPITSAIIRQLYGPLVCASSSLKTKPKWARLSNEPLKKRVMPSTSAKTARRGST